MLKELLGSLFLKQRRWAVQEVQDLLWNGKLEEARDASENLHPATKERDLYRQCLQAEINFKLGKDDEAETGFRNVLKHAPGFPNAHYGLSLLLMIRGDVNAAIEHAQFAKLQSPNDARFLSHLGLCYVTAGNFPSADEPLSKAVRINSDDKLAWNNLGLVFLAKGNPSDALNCFQRALQIDEGFISARQNFNQLKLDMEKSGVVVLSVMPKASTPEDGHTAFAPWEIQWNEVLQSLELQENNSTLGKAEDICMQWPDSAGVFIRTAALYHDLGDTQGAVDLLAAFIFTHPNELHAIAALGSAYLGLGEYKLAEEQFLRVIADGLEDVKVFSNLAKALSAQELHIEAVFYRRRAVSIEPTFMHKAHLASSLVSACQYEEAVAIFDELLLEQPDSRRVFLLSYAAALAYLGKLEIALSLMNEALQIQPEDAAIHMQRAQINLLLENFKQGWVDYGYRSLAYTKQYRVLPFSKWQGQDLSGKTIVVLAEQGLGDQIMFASCLPDLLSSGPRKVIVEAISRVAKTLARSFPECEFIASTQGKGMGWAKSLVDIDYFVPLADLPRYFRSRVEDFPGNAYLRPDNVRAAHWRRQLEATGPRPWIGVSWRGGLQATRQVVRSLQIEEFLGIGKNLNATWVNLQYGDVGSDLHKAEDLGIKLSHWPEAISDLDEFSALVSQLDCVVTVCNTTVHYAGALGRRVIVLAPSVPEWRYGLNFTHMPWYADVEVLRQTKHNDWGDPIHTASCRLHSSFGETSDIYVTSDT